MSSWTAAGPSFTSTRTASTSHTPAPATRVSFRCCSGVSSGPSAAAMPPCAHCVEPDESRSLVTTSTDPTPDARTRRAAVRPAMPEPTTTTSAYVVQPGPGALSRAGILVILRTLSAQSAGEPVTPGETAASDGLRRIRARADDPVLRVDEDDVRTQLTGLGGLALRVADQDHHVARLHEPRGGAVDADHARAPRPGDRVGLETRAVGHVDDVHQLTGQQVRGLEELLVDG